MQCDFCILINIYAITGSKKVEQCNRLHVNMFTEYSNRVHVDRSNTFSLIQDNEYISKDAATLKRATKSVRLNHEMGSADSGALYQPLQHCNVTGICC